MTDQTIEPKITLNGELIQIDEDCYELDGSERFDFENALMFVESTDESVQRISTGLTITAEDYAADDWMIVPIKEGSTYLSRMLVERTQLVHRLDALSAFLAGEQPEKINDENWQLLHDQHKHMTSYFDTLCKRIALAEAAA